MSTRDKKVQVILQYLNPFECFEEVCQALKGMDYPVDMLLNWMHESEFKDSNNQYYTERARYNEREKITRFNSFLTLADKQEGDRVRGYSTLLQLWNKAGMGSELQLEAMAEELEDDDVEFNSGGNGRAGAFKRVQIKRYYQYEKIDPDPIKVTKDKFTDDFREFITHLFKSDDNMYFSMDCFGGMTVSFDRAMKMGAGPLFVNINPCTGNGIQNVTDFRHYLLEIDEDKDGNLVPLEKQYGWLLASKLPISTITYSGGKSLHATVKIEAKDLAEYRNRVDEVRDYCIQLGMPLDTRVIDPCRYTRVAGGFRDGNLQYLANVNVGPRDYQSWLIDRNYYLKAEEK